MIRKLLFGFVLAIVAGIGGLVLFAGGENYNTDFPPPSSLTAETWPQSIAGESRALRPIQSTAGNLKGATARYGQAASITIVAARDQAALDSYVDTIKAGLAVYGSHSSGKLNGAWWIEGSGAPGRIYAWQKRNLLYSIEAASDPVFDEIVEKFAFISAK